MATRTYMDQCLKEGVTVRWPEKTMPIKVFIAPFTWYEKSKQADSGYYRQMVIEAMDLWSKASGGIVRFQLVASLNESQMDIKWRRADRKSLGHCEYMINDKAQLYSAEIQIGISDGILHAKYNDTNEVRHTIVHEFGHALGLVGHSPYAEDIMYVPHQYGVIAISQRDVDTLRWLYKLPVGFNYLSMGEKYDLKHPFTIHDVVEKIAGKTGPKRTFAKPKPPRKEQPEKLHEDHDILSRMGRFYMSTQNIQLPKEVKDKYIDDQKNKPDNP